VTTGLTNFYGAKQIMASEWHPTLYNTHSHILNPVYDAYYAPMGFLSFFRAGLVNWNWWALIDYATSQLAGLFAGPIPAAANAKPAAYTIRAMYTLLGDTGAGKHTFAPGKINYTVTGGLAPTVGSPNTGFQTMLFQNSLGVFCLFAWCSQADPGGAGTPATIHFNSHVMTQVIDYKISDASSPTAPTTAVQTLSGVSSITVPGDGSVHMLIIHY
jgi:hypothetical protein